MSTWKRSLLSFFRYKIGSSSAALSLPGARNPCNIFESESPVGIKKNRHPWGLRSYMRCCLCRSFCLSRRHWRSSYVLVDGNHPERSTSCRRVSIFYGYIRLSSRRMARLSSHACPWCLRSFHWTWHDSWPDYRKHFVQEGFKSLKREFDFS